jgi:Uncharacterized protein conserved in bacteria (DUF2330)
VSAHWGAVLAALLAACSIARDTRACAPAAAEGEAVAIASEEAIIVWDAKDKTEHFIRRAAFRTTSKDFGFLVPTPTEPKFAAAKDSVFDALNEFVKPEVIHKRHSYVTVGSWLMLSRLKSEAVAAGVPGVTVLSVTRVAGLDAAVLEADSATAIGEWLKQHGYAFRDELVRWLEPYVKAKWKINAFKIAKGGDSASEDFGTQALRMTFRTEKPFYPYREPADQRRAPLSPNPWEKRRLRVFVFSSERVQGQLERPGGWPGRPTFSKNLPDASALLAGALDSSDSRKSGWLTAFEDESDPRPGVADVFFAKDDDQREFRPPPIVVLDDAPIIIPIELLLLLVIGVGVGISIPVIARKRRAR